MTENLRPAIRFAEFTDDWEQRKLGELGTLKNGMNFSKDAMGHGYAFVNLQNIFGNNVVDVQNLGLAEASEKQLIEYSLLKGDVLFARSSVKLEGVGEAALVPENLENMTYSGFIIRFRDEYGLNGNFKRYVFGTKKVRDQIMAQATNSANKNISQAVLENLTFDIPSCEEQKKVGEYFAALDHLITLHQKKYDKIVSIRASMLEKLFVQDADSLPQIRFGQYKTPWKKVKLGEIVVPYSDPVETPHDGYERLGIRSHGKGVFHDYVEAGKELGAAQMHKVSSHNLIVNITFAWEHAVAITDDNDAGKLVSHRFPQFAMTDDIYDQFLKYMILDARFRHHLLLSSPGGAGRNRVLKVSEMLEYEMMIPEVEEQKQIADYLNSLDELISLYKVRVQKLKNIKMACLQKMFV